MRYFGWLNFVLAVTCLSVAGLADSLEAQTPGNAANHLDQEGSEAVSFQTKAGYAACTSRVSLVQLVTLIAQEETEAHQAMVSDTSSGCFLLKPGVAVEPVGYNEYFVELRPVGMEGTIFTIVEAIERKEEGHDQ